MRRAALVALAAAACAPVGAPAPLPILERQASGTTALLQAVSAPSSDVVWASGHRGTWLRSLDGGRTWQVGGVPGGDSLQFRDVHAASASQAWLLSAGPGEASRIYATTDGGASWTEQFRNTNPAAFYDCFDFWDARRGIAFSDAADGRLMLLVTGDGGRHWTLVPAEALPAPLAGEGAFAASGTCVVTAPGGHAWVAMGNAPVSRVLHTDDYGRTWSVSDAPIAAGEAAGLATIAMHGDRALAAGGPIAHNDSLTDNVLVSDDRGATWTKGGRPGFPGAIFGAAFVPRSRATVVAVGPGGAAASSDGGRSWAPVDSASYWGIGFAPDGTGWITGPGGRITRLLFR